MLTYPHQRHLHAIHILSSFSFFQWLRATVAALSSSVQGQITIENLTLEADKDDKAQLAATIAIMRFPIGSYWLVFSTLAESNSLLYLMIFDGSRWTFFSISRWRLCFPSLD